MYYVLLISIIVIYMELTRFIIVVKITIYSFYY